ncbi:hypothetical protein PG993_007674 [Apiospora rasikravindrae]|uniref:DUF7600 domain-containing protein n=1 Tax=Apiospora rasikravindrae TaxID=990691 RepID=A0ABR1SY65_9PEZI
MSDIYCALCGVQVEVHDGDTAEDSELRWNAAVRAVRARAYVHEPYVTGVGYLNEHRQICADTDESISYKDHAAQLVANDLHNTGFQQYWCYAVHDFCWKLLRHTVDPEGSFPSKTIARHLFAILYNTPANLSGGLLPGHDYGGALQSRSNDTWAQDPVSTIFGSDLFYILQDPDDEFDFEAESMLDSLPSTSYMSIQEAESGKTDVFNRLPSEIIMLILLDLPSRTVCNLRLASKHVAAYTAPSLLSQRFWASRFNGDEEMVFAFALRDDNLPPEPIDWRQLYQKAQSMLRNFQTYPGFMNRRRIWKALRHVTPALTLRLQNMGTVARAPYLGRPPRIPEEFSSLGSVSSNVTLEFAQSTTPPLAAGSRLFEKQYIGLPKPAESQILRLGVSFIPLANKNYICGLRVLAMRESEEYSEYSRTGFINPLNEQTLELDSLEDVGAISFHVTISGIIGLCFQTRTVESPRFFIAGQFDECTDVDSGFSELKVGKKLQDIGLVVGLDACKVVSLELFGSQPATEPLSLTENTNVAQVWTPASPECRIEWKHDYPATQQSFNLCTAMDFGGRDGQLLDLLTQVNVYMGMFPQVFLGMSFTYADGSERTFGRKFYTMRNGTKYQCIVQSFSLAGQKGERICQADTAYSPSHDTIQRLSFSTTANRSIAFGLHGEHIPQGTLFHTTRRAPASRVFTSFFSLHSSPSGHFRDFAVLDIPAGQAHNDSSTSDIALCKTPWDAIITSMLYSAKELLAHNGGFAFTSASLSGLRRVQVSVGDVGFSREPHHISGLMLEYEGSALPVVVGQWISEHKSLEISADERVVEVVTFHHANNRFNRVKFGPLSGIWITTSKGTTMKVIMRPAEGDVRLCFRETPYERLDTIAWGCNYQWDHVRVISRYHTDVAHLELLFGPFNRQGPEWAVREQVFLQEKTIDGCSDSLEAIQMTFKWMTSEPAALSFIFRSGRVLSLGAPGEKPITETLNEGEQLSRMDIGILRNNRVTSIQFTTDQGRTLMFTYPSSHRLKVQRWEVHILKHGIDSEGTDHEELEVVQKMPETASRVVGFWAIPRRLDRALQFPSFGPIFEQNADCPTTRE